MATTIRASEWDNSSWAEPGPTGTATIAVNDQFTVSTVDTSNRVLRLLPAVSSYAKEIRCVNWDDSNIWALWPLPFTLGQTFVVTTVDLSNRIVTLSG